jgi:hypothetical protein
LNVTVLYHNGILELVRLNGNEPPIEISKQMWFLLCLFDGETSRAEAICFAEKLLGEGSGRATVDGLLALIDYANLEAADIFDEQALGGLLATADGPQTEPVAHLGATRNR